MTTPQTRMHRLRVRYLIASVTTIAAAVVELILSRFTGPVQLWAWIPVAVVLGCAITLHRTAGQMQQFADATASEE